MGRIRHIKIYGAAGPDEPKLWVQNRLRWNTDQTCGELFGAVFEEHFVLEAQVCLNGEPVHRLREEDNLMSVLTSLRLGGVVVIWAKDRAD